MRPKRKYEPNLRELSLLCWLRVSLVTCALYLIFQLDPAWATVSLKFLLRQSRSTLTRTPEAPRTSELVPSTLERTPNFTKTDTAQNSENGSATSTELAGPADATSADGCSNVRDLKLNGKVVICEYCGPGEPVRVETLNTEVCFLLARSSCLSDELVDGVIWDGTNYVTQPAPTPQRHEKNAHQIWFAFSSETHAPPYWRRPVGDKEWMQSMNYARHYGQNTDFLVDAYAVAGLKVWQSVDQSVIDRKTHWIVYLTSNCASQSERDDFAQRLSFYLDITSIGSCFNNAQVPSRIKHLEADENGENLRQNWKNYGPGTQAIIAPYRFRLLIISTLCYDYWTEKVEQTLSAGVIPIYLGMPNSHDWDPGIAAGVHPAMIHIQDFDGLAELSDFVLELGADSEEARLRRNKYREYQMQPPSMFPRHGERFTNRSDNGDWGKYICERVHEGNVERLVEPQLPCLGTWWQFLESLGKNLSKWGCTDDWPCVVREHHA